MTTITIALSKGRIFDETLPLLAAAGIVPDENPETSRKLIIGTNRPDVRVVIVRATDVPTYVQYGAADLGVAGKDVLIEHGGQGLYAPLDLKIARCRMMVAVPEGFDYQNAVRQGARLKVASKYIKTAREHFAAKGVHVDLIKLYGSMELAPLAGLADAIVDLVFNRRHAEGQQAGRGRGNHADFVAPGGQPGLAQGQARNPATDHRRLCPGGGEVTWLSRSSALPRSTPISRQKWTRCSPSRPQPTTTSNAPSPASWPTSRRAAMRRWSTTPTASTACRLARWPTWNCRRASCRAALDGLSADRRTALEAAAGRIRAYHERQKLEGWSYTEADGTMLGQMITPLDRVGLYVPGGKAAYPSSVLMNAIPAKVAGVRELIMVVPTPDGEKEPAGAGGGLSGRR